MDEDPRTPDASPDPSPDPSPGPAPDPAPDRALRSDIRRVTSILGETLARTEGADLLALVEEVRAHAKEDRLDARLAFALMGIPFGALD